jgi:hypothetical protein
MVGGVGGPSQHPLLSPTGTTETTGTPTTGPLNPLGADPPSDPPPPLPNEQPTRGSGQPEPAAPREPPQDLSGTMLRLTEFGARLFNIQDVFNEVLKSNQELKKITRIDREARLDSVEQSARAAAAEMRIAAAWSLAGTIISSSAQIVGAGMSVTGAVKAQQKMNQVLGGSDASQKLVNPQTETLPKTQTNAPLKKDTNIEMQDFSSKKSAPQIETKTEPRTQTQTPPKEIDANPKTDTGPEVSNSLDPRNQLMRMAKMDQAKTESSVISAQWQYKASTVSEGGKIAGGVFNIAGQWTEATKAEEQARGQREQALAENEGDFKQAAEKAIANVLEKMAEIQRAQSQAITTIVRSA